MMMKRSVLSLRQGVEPEHREAETKILIQMKRTNTFVSEREKNIQTKTEFELQCKEEKDKWVSIKNVFIIHLLKLMKIKHNITEDFDGI